MGGSLEGQVFVGRYLGVHALVGGRAADADYAEGVASHLRVGLGAAFRVHLAPRVEVGTSADVLLLRDGIRHLSPDFDEPAPVFSGRLLAGARGELRLSYFLTESAALELGAGAEVAFGVTDVYLNRKVAGTIVPLRLGLEPGIRVRF